MSGFEQLFPGKLPRRVLFDLDGTLLDSVPDLAAAVDQMLLKLGRKPAGIESVRKWVGNGAPMLVRACSFCAASNDCAPANTST